MQPTEAVLASWLALGRDRRSRFEEVDIPFYWVMAPNKHTVHPEQLPVFARAELRECDVDALGQAFARAGVPFLDLRTQLVELPHDPPLYYQTDTHWNQLGAAHAVALLIEEIRRQFPAVPPFSFEPFDVAVGPELFEGNLAARLRVYGEHYEEPFLRLERRSPPTARLDPMQDPIDLRVHSREDPVLEFSTGRAELPTAWVFHDSFGFATMELLAEHFKSVRFVNSHGWIDAGHFERELPDLVIALFVENRIQEAARFEPDWRIKRDLVQVR
jgi:hypothetical protein